jgi:hypothetical protein
MVVTMRTNRYLRSRWSVDMTSAGTFEGEERESESKVKTAASRRSPRGLSGGAKGPIGADFDLDSGPDSGRGRMPRRHPSPEGQACLHEAMAAAMRTNRYLRSLAVGRYDLGRDVYGRRRGARSRQEITWSLRFGPKASGRDANTRAYQTTPTDDVAIEPSRLGGRDVAPQGWTGWGRKSFEIISL